jgi:hypothetical protein
MGKSASALGEGLVVKVWRAKKKDSGLLMRCGVAAGRKKKTPAASSRGFG